MDVISEYDFRNKNISKDFQDYIIEVKLLEMKNVLRVKHKAKGDSTLKYQFDLLVGCEKYFITIGDKIGVLTIYR